VSAEDYASPETAQALVGWRSLGPDGSGSVLEFASSCWRTACARSVSGVPAITPRRFPRCSLVPSRSPSRRHLGRVCFADGYRPAWGP